MYHLAMRKHRGGLTGLALALTLVTAVWLADRSSEPRYQSRSLSSWLAQCESTLPNTNGILNDPPGLLDARRNAIQACAAMGTNAIPYLLDWLTYEPPAIPQRFDWLLTKAGLGWLRTPCAKRQLRAEQTNFAFEGLGTNAASAIPELGRLVLAYAPSTRTNGLTAVTNAVALRAICAIDSIYNDAVYSRPDIDMPPLIRDGLASTNPVLISLARYHLEFDWGPPLRVRLLNLPVKTFGTRNEISTPHWPW